MNPIPELRILLANFSLATARNESGNLHKLQRKIEKFDKEIIIEQILNDLLEGYFFNHPIDLPFLANANEDRLTKQWNQNIKTDVINRYYLPLILKALEKDGLYPVINRGIVWNKYYPNRIFRRACDIDMFIEPERSEKYENALIAQGWTKHTIYSHLWLKNGAEIDLHAGLFGTGDDYYLPIALNLPYEKLSNNSEFSNMSEILFSSGNENSLPLENLGRANRNLPKIRTFDLVDDFIYNSVHWVKHSFQYMRWGVELALVCDKISRLNKWDEVLERVEDYKVRRIFKSAAIPLANIFDLQIPVRSILETNDFSFIEKSLLARISQGYRLPFCGKYLVANASKNIKQRIRFYAKGILPNKTDRIVDRFRYPGVNKLFTPALRFLRIFRAGFKLVFSYRK